MKLLDRLLQPGNKIKIKFVGTGFEGFAHTYIIRSANEEQLTLLFKDNETSIDNFSPGTMLKLISHDEESGHDYRLLTELIEVKTGELPRLVVKRPTDIDHSTRRNSLRLNVNLPFSYYDDLKEKTGEVRNLSINGLLALVQSSPSLKPDYGLTGKLFLPDTNKPLILIGKIIRVEAEENDNSWIALDFQSASEEVKNKISRYLVQCQRHLINTNKKSIANNPPEFLKINEKRTVI